MNIIIKLTNLIIPLIIFIIVGLGIKEKKNVFDLFVEGSKKGMNTTVDLVPILIAIFFSIGLLRASGLIDFIVYLFGRVMNFICFPSEVLPLALIRPISGSGALGMAIDIIENCGVDSYIGRVAAVVMGSTETSLYVIALYTGCLKVKKENKLIISALFADFIGIVCAVIICRFL